MNRSRFSLETEDLVNLQEIDRNKLKKFADGASTHKADAIESLTDWKNEDPDELPSYNFRLRLNKYQIGLLKHVAHFEKRSLSNMIKVILAEGLSKRI